MVAPACHAITNYLKAAASAADPLKNCLLGRILRGVPSGSPWFQVGFPATCDRPVWRPGLKGISIHLKAALKGNWYLFKKKVGLERAVEKGFKGKLFSQGWC